MLSDEEVEAFRAAVGEAARAHDRRSEHFKRTVFAAVDQLKSAGLPPERIIVMLRHLIVTTPAAQAFPSVGDILAAWCAERYYGPKPSRDEEPES